MQPFLDNPALKLFALVGALLGVHLILLAFWTGTVRVKYKQWVNPEDAKLNKGEQATSDHPEVQRTQRAHHNGLENAVPFLAVGLLFALTNPSHTAAQIYYFVFLAARVLHSIFYLWGRQPFRTLMFATGALATLGMAQHVIRAAL